MHAFMTVVKKDGQRYAAQDLQILHKGWGGDFSKKVLAFECSDVLTVFDVEEVDRIEFGVNPDQV